MDLKLTFYFAIQEVMLNTPAFSATGIAGHKINTGPRRTGESEKISKVGQQKYMNEALVNRHKIIFLPLHIKLGLMKQFVKALDKEGNCF